jgi:periplasmic protein CpxP/Spy
MILARRLAALVAAMVLVGPAAGAASAQGAARVQAPASRPGLDRLAEVVQRRLRLTDDQATRLRETTGRFATERQQLIVRERDTRRALRAQIALGDSADQRAVTRQLDDLVRLQQRRVQLLAEEQRELARFLTPIQRAQFIAMQERAFRAAQQLRQRRAARTGDAAVP